MPTAHLVRTDVFLANGGSSGYDGGLRRENLRDEIDSVPHTSLSTSTSSTVGLQSVPAVQLPSHKFTRLNPGVVTKAAVKVKEAPISAAITEEVKSIKEQIKGKYCTFEECTRYRQSGCYGYCLTHRHLAETWTRWRRGK